MLQQVCSLCLGAQCQISSVNTSYVFVKDACTFVGSCRGKTDAIDDVDDDDWEQGASQADLNPSTAAAADGLEAQQAFVINSAKVFDGLALRNGAAPSYKYLDTTKPMEAVDAFASMVCPQHRFMADRGEAAANVCLWEFASLFDPEQTEHSKTALADHRDKTKAAEAAALQVDAPAVVPEPATTTKRASKGKTAATRTANLRVPLTENNILHRDWTLKLKSKYNLPVFCGRRPDRCPPFVAPELRDQDWQNCADQFAQRMLVLFSPWLTEHHIRNPELLKELMPASDTSAPAQHEQINLYVPIALIDTCEEDQDRTDWDRLMDFMQAGEQTFIGRCKNRVIQNLADNLSSSANTDSSRAILMKFRARNATVWSDKNKADPSLVDKNIGNRKYASRAYALVPEEEAAIAAQADEELQQQVEQFQAMCDGSELQPTAWEQHERAFVVEQTDGFKRVYGLGSEQEPLSTLYSKRLPIETVTDGHLVKHNHSFDEIVDKLKNKHAIKTAPPPLFPNPSAACPADVIPKQAKVNMPNADQRNAIDLIVPLIESYQLFNANPLHHPTVVARQFLITGGPGTGINCKMKLIFYFHIYFDGVKNILSRKNIRLQTNYGTMPGR